MPTFYFPDQAIYLLDRVLVLVVAAIGLLELDDDQGIEYRFVFRKRQGPVDSRRSGRDKESFPRTLALCNGKSEAR